MTLIAVEITPGPDGRCGECEVKVGHLQSCAWAVWREVGEVYGDPPFRKGELFRGPLCLAAEQQIAAIRREARVEGMREARKLAQGRMESYNNASAKGRFYDEREWYRQRAMGIEDHLVSLDAMIAKEEAK